MKRHLAILATIFISLFAMAQKSTDAEFNKRLNDYMRLNREAKFEEMMDYTHPNLFKLASREQLIQVFKQAFDNDNFSMSIDSTAITAISDSFKNNNVTYKRIDYWMDAKLTLKDTTSVHDKERMASLKSALEMGFPGGTVNFSETTGKFDIQTSTLMIAIKDNDSTPWMFLGYQKNAQLLNQLYPKEVIDHFNLL